MKRLHNILLSLALIALSSWSVHAQQFGKGERGEKIKALWVAFVTQQLDLTPEESAKFWPIFNEFKEKERELKRKRRQLAPANVDNLNEAEIEKLFSQSLDIEREGINLKEEYFKKLQTAIPARKIVMLPKVEREFKKRIIEFIQERRENNAAGGRGQRFQRGRR